MWTEIWGNFLIFYHDSVFISHILIPVLIILVGYFASILVSRIMLKLCKAVTSKTKTTLDDRIFVVFYPPIKWILFLYTCYLALESIPGEPKILKAIQLGLVSIIIIIFTVILTRVLKVIIAWFVEAKSQKMDQKVSKEFIPVLDKIGVVLLYLLGIIWVLDNAGVNVSGLVVSLGVGGVAIGLAAKDALANIIAGFMIMLDKPFRAGDRIELSDGRIGDVVEVRLRTTRVATFDDTIMIIPNQEVLQQVVVNYAYPTRRYKRNILLQVAYGTDLDKAKKVILDVCDKDDLVLSDPPPLVWVTGFGESGMNIMVNIWVAELTTFWKAQCRVVEEIYKAFAKAGIEIPYPSRTVFLKDNEGGKKRKK
jgi:MscS family membrane protein